MQAARPIRSFAVWTSSASEFAGCAKLELLSLREHHFSRLALIPSTGEPVCALNCTNHHSRFWPATCNATSYASLPPHAAPRAALARCFDDPRPDDHCGRARPSTAATPAGPSHPFILCQGHAPPPFVAAGERCVKTLPVAAGTDTPVAPRRRCRCRRKALIALHSGLPLPRPRRPVFRNPAFRPPST